MGARASKSSPSSGKRKPDDDDLETKPVLKKQKEHSDEKEETLTEGLADSVQHKSDDQEGDLIQEVAIRETKTLFVAHLTPQTEISHIINFFQDVGQVVDVRLILNKKGKPLGWGFVEFASANEAEKVLQTKNGEYFQGRNIFLEVAKTQMNPLSPPKYEDNLLRESNLKQQEEKSVLIKFCGKKTTFSYDDEALWFF